MKFRALTYLAISIVTAFSNLAYADGATLEHLSFSDAKTFFSSNNRELILAKRMLESAETFAVIAAQKPNPVLSLGIQCWPIEELCIGSSKTTFADYHPSARCAKYSYYHK